MLKKVGFVVIAAVFTATLAAAQQSKAPSKAPAAKAVDAKAADTKPETETVGQPINVKIEVSITDQTGSGTPAKKLVSMIASDRNQNFIRSSASVPVRGTINPSVNYRNVTINVDARPTVLAKDPTKIHLVMGLEYLPKTAGNQEEMEPGMAQLSERLALILESGKPMVVSQAADPMSDRKITVEVTATILK
jgi:hypothetical protein